MVLVTSYTHLRKRDLHQSYRPFVPLRAVGLSLELGWKLARDKGITAVSSQDLGKVSVFGDLRVNGVSATECTLQLRAVDANLAKLLLQKQRALLADLGFNVWCVDYWQHGCSRRLDLLGDFTVDKAFGVAGRVWVELKVFSDTTFAEEVRRWKLQLQTCLVTENARDGSIQAVMLLAARVTRASGGAWGKPTLTACLLTMGSDEWLHLAGGRTAARGQVRGPKPPLAKLWRGMEWHFTDGGRCVGLLKHFLRELGLPRKHAGQRADTYNALLRKAGKPGRLVEKRLQSKSGRPPWVASKDTFRDLYPLV